MQFNKTSAASCLARKMSVLKSGNGHLLFLFKSLISISHRTFGIWKCYLFWTKKKWSLCSMGLGKKMQMSVVNDVVNAMINTRGV